MAPKSMAPCEEVWLAVDALRSGRTCSIGRLPGGLVEANSHLATLLHFTAISMESSEAVELEGARVVYPNANPYEDPERPEWTAALSLARLVVRAL